MAHGNISVADLEVCSWVVIAGDLLNLIDIKNKHCKNNDVLLVPESAPFEHELYIECMLPSNLILAKI